MKCNKPTMKVFSYFEPLGLNDAEPLVPLWTEAWTRAGFEPVVLGPKDLYDSDNRGWFEEFKATVSAYPTVNPPGYDLACYLRWFAFHTRMMRDQRDGGKALMVDLDVMPTGITPDYPFGAKNVFLDPAWVPCAVASTWFGSGLLVQALEEGPVMTEVHGRPHCSDMIVFQERAWKYAAQIPICLEYGGWTRDTAPANALLTHFPASRVGSNKAAAIQKYLSS